MAIPFHRPLLCPILLGRSAQCSALEQALDQARAGSGPTVVISGEAGIGKSRLIAEARTRAEERGFLSLEGHCFEPDRDLPYAPVLDLMHRWLAASAGGSGAAGCTATALAY